MNARVAWNALADKALGTIMIYLTPDIVVQFDTKTTLQELLLAIAQQYTPDTQQEIDRLENSLNNLEYNGEDPVVWTAGIKELIAKLTAKQATPTDRHVRTVVLAALEKEPEYKVRVEVIRQTQPNITLNDLWLTIGRFTYSIKRNETLLYNMNCFNDFVAVKIMSSIANIVIVKVQSRICSDF